MSNAASASAVGSFWIFVLPFIAWAFYGVGNLIDKIRGAPTVNGAAVYNWLSLAIVFIAGVGGGPERLGALLVAFSVSWIVGRSLSKKYRYQRDSKSGNPAETDGAGLASKQ